MLEIYLHLFYSMKKLLSFGLCFFGFYSLLIGQANYWYFGDYAGLKFNGTGTPTALNNSVMRTGEGSAVITNQNGDLLFYTDGTTIWNSKHKADITGLKGSPSSTQSALIIPVPETNCTRYFVFTSGPAEDFSIGANVVLVELSGDPVTTGTTVKKIEGPTRMYSASCVEKLNGIKDGKGGYWVLNHEWQNNKYHSYHVTKNTTDITKLLATDVVTAIGKSQTGILTNSQGQLKFNRAGTKMAITVADDKFVELYDFDLSSGKPSNVQLIQNNDPNFSSYKTIFSGTANLYGLEFSNNGKYLYVAEFFTGGSASVFQFDISLSTLDSIRRSNVVLATNSHSSRYPYGALQMGPDGKIYVATNARKSLAVINKPDLKGTNSNFVENGFTLLKDCYLGLPTTIVVDMCCTTQKPDLGKDTMFCAGSSVTLKDTTKNVTSYLWSNSSTNATISVSSPGDYWVQINRSGCTARDTIKVSVVQPPKVKLGNDTTICQVSGFTLTANPTGLTYLWNTSATTRSIKINSAGKYWVRGSDKGCFAYDTITILSSNLQKPRLGNDTTICMGDTLFINGAVSGAKSYNWNTGNKTSKQKAFTTGKYILEVSDSLCTKADTINLTVVPYPKVNLGRDTGFCGNFTLTLDAKNPGIKKKWSTGDTTQTLVIATHIKYWVELNDRGCKSADTLAVNKLPGPFINLGKDTVYCGPINRTFQALNPGMNYLWSDGSSNSAFSVIAPGKYWVRISDNSSCVFTDTILLTDGTFKFNLGKDTTVCFGQVVNLKAKDSTYSHNWNTGQTTANLLVSKTGRYIVKVGNGFCSFSDTINLSVLPAIVFDLGQDTYICENLNESTTLTGPAGYMLYLWTPGGEITQDIVVTKSGVYTLKVTDNTNCSASDSIKVDNLCPVSLWVPTAFSPNSGSNNAKFGVSYQGPPVLSFEMRIFNRWGEMLYRTETITDYWDGIYMEKPCQLGMYLCIINLTSKFGNDVKRTTYQGMFYLNR